MDNSLKSVKDAVFRLSLQDLGALRDYASLLLDQRNRANIRVGDLVECLFNGGETIRFRVERINAKTLSGREDGGKRRLCRAPPASCRLVGADRPAHHDDAQRGQALQRRR
jgi:hypothetical protein